MIPNPRDWHVLLFFAINALLIPDSNSLKCCLNFLLETAFENLGLEWTKTLILSLEVDMSEVTDLISDKDRQRVHSTSLHHAYYVYYCTII